MKQFFIIDAIGFLFRSFFAIRGMKAPDGTPTNALYGFIRSLEKLFHDFQVENCVAVFDGPNNKASRTKIYEQYKGHRSQMPDELAIQLKLAHQFCDLYGIPQLSIPNVEADDVIGTLAMIKKEEGFHVHIVSQDKDLCQLVSKHIDLIQTHKDNLIVDGAKVLELYGVKPEQITDYLAIIGDSSDNIPGIAGIGPKTAVKLLEEFTSLEGLYKNLDQIESDKKRQQIFDAKDLAFLSKQLATLDLAVKVPEEKGFYIRSKQDDAPLFAFYEKMGFKSLIKELPNQEVINAPSKKSSFHFRLIETEKDLIDYLGSLKPHKAICIDCETTSLDKFEAQILGIGIGADETNIAFIPFHHQLDPELICSYLKPFFENTHHEFFGHNFKFDLHMLKNHGLFPKKLCFDTILASYVVHPENNRHNLDTLSLEILNLEKIPIESLIGEGKKQKPMQEVPLDLLAKYCAEDVFATILLKRHFENVIEEEKLTEVYYQIDLPLVPILYEMERHGINVDLGTLQDLSKTLLKDIHHLEKKIYEQAGQEFNIKSPKQLSEILFEKLQIPTKAKKTTLGFSTSADVLEDLKGKHPIIEYVLQYRTLEKLRSTYVDALPDQINRQTHRIHCTFNQSVTATGRLSCQDPNLQNIPVRGEIGTQIRSAFCPNNKADLFLAADYSQIELRILAHLSQDPQLIKAFKQDEDIHRLTASLIFDCDKKDVTDEMRYQAKAVNFGIIYGQQAFGLSKEIGISMKEASEFIKKYFERYPGVAAFLENEKEKARKTGFAKSLLGRRRLIEDINNKNPMLRGQAERYAINTPIQGTQSDLMKMAMIKIDHAFKKHHLKSFMVLQIHDELIFEIKDQELEIVKKIVLDAMENIFPMEVPLKVNIAIGKNWGEC